MAVDDGLSFIAGHLVIDEEDVEQDFNGDVGVEHSKVRRGCIKIKLPKTIKYELY